MAEKAIDIMLNCCYCKDLAHRYISEWHFEEDERANRWLEMGFISPERYANWKIENERRAEFVASWVDRIAKHVCGIPEER